MRQKSIASSTSFVQLRGRCWNTSVGPGLPLRIAVALGANSGQQLECEVDKLARILSPSERHPDILVDLSTFAAKRRFYETMLAQFGGPVGLLPHYLCFNGSEINPDSLLREMERAVSCGVGLFTLHITATFELWQLASRTRRLPTTSRGGGILIQDMLNSGRRQNVFQKHWPELVSLLRGAKVAVSLGSTFRPATCAQAMDEVHIAETLLQSSIAAQLTQQGIPVIREGLGHAHVNQILQYGELLSKQDIRIPLMTLGPLTIDSAGSFDALAAAMGISVLANQGDLSLVQTITAQEHAGGIPDAESVGEALRNNRIVADSVNAGHGYRARSLLLGLHRESNSRCVTPIGNTGIAVRGRDQSGCSRCDMECPLQIEQESRRDTIDFLLRRNLPHELHRIVLPMTSHIQSRKWGTLLLFGSSASGHFSYCRSGNTLRVLSDVEMNVIKDEDPTDTEQDDLNGILLKYNNMIGNEQPLFEIDIRFRTRLEAASLPYDSQMRRTLFCYSVSDYGDIEECISSETDMIPRQDLGPQFLRSALEWGVLRLAYIQQLRLESKEWWLSAILTSITCKLAPIFCSLGGIPWTATPLDVCQLRAVADSDQLNRFARLLDIAWKCRSDNSGSRIEAKPIHHTDLVWAIKEALKYVESMPGKTETNHAAMQNGLCELLLDESAWRVPAEAWFDQARALFSEIYETIRKGNSMFWTRYRKCLGGI